MTIAKATLKTSAQQQVELWNSAGPHVIQQTYAPPAGTNWAIVGLVMADAFDPDTDETTIVNAVEALSEVTTVGNPRIYGQTDADIEINPEAPEDPTHEWVLLVNSTMSMQAGTAGDKRTRVERELERVKPPSGKQWLVLNLVVPSPLDAAGIAVLESAIQGVTGITTCEHLIDGTVRADATQVSLQIEARIRLDEIEV
jgi:hypothetical protein